MTSRRLPRWAGPFMAVGAVLICFAVVIGLIGIIATGGWA